MTDEIRPSHKTTILLAFLLIAVAAFATYEFREVGRLHASVVMLQQAADKDHQALAAEKREAAITAAAASTSVKSVLANNTPPGFEHGADLTHFIENDPEYPILHAQHVAQLVRNTYGSLKGLGLSQAQERKLVELLEKRLTTPNDARDAALKRGIRDNSEIARAIIEASKEIESEIQSLIGASGFETLENESRRIEASNKIQLELGRDMIAIGKPLTASQLSSLADVWFNTPQDRRMESASEILTPEQFEVFREKQEMQPKLDALRHKAMDAAEKQYGKVPMPFYLRGP